MGSHFIWSDNEPDLAATLRRRSAILWDAAIICMLVPLAYSVASIFNLFEALQIWIEQYEAFQFDEFLIVLLLLAFASLVFSFRRWQELKTEIATRAQLEAVIRKTEVQLRAILTSAPITIFALDSQGVFTLSEGKGLERVDLRPGENVGVSGVELYSTIPFTAPNGEVIEGQEVIRRTLAGETLTLHSELRGVHFDNHIGPLRDTAGNVTGIVGVAVDITERRQAELALTESQHRLQALFDHALEIILLANDDGFYVDVNPAACVSTGYSRAELLEMGVWDLTPKPNRELGQALWRDFIAIGQQSGEYLLCCRDGTLLEAEYRAVANIVPGLHLSILRDITERKRVEETLQQQAQIIDQIHDSVISTDMDGYITSWNKGAERLFGYSANEAHDQHIAFVYPPDQHQFLQQAVIAPLMEKGQYEVEVRMQKKSGQEFYAHLSLSLVKNKAGEASGMIGYSIDITERKQVEDELRRHRERLQKIVDHIPVMIAYISPEGQTEWINPEWEHALGWTLAEIQSRNVLLEMYPDPAERQAVLDFALHPTTRWGEFKTRVKDGRVLDTAWTNVLLSDGSSIGIGQDITERKQAEEALRRAHERLHHLSRQLLAVQEKERRYIALELHDQIGQNLTAIKLTLQAAERTDPASPLLPNLQQGLAATEQTLELVRNLALDLRPSILDDLGLVAALRWYVDRQARQTGLAISFKATGLETRPDPALETACFRVAQEALTNIGRHARAQQVWVELRQTATGLTLLIRDDGQGFEVTSALEQAAQGASVGLLGMQERAKLVGGQLDIESASGHGTEIRAFFPLTTSGETAL